VLQRAESFAAALRPASLTSLVLGLLVSAVLG
jgi:STE24 endopeptidase